MLGALFNGYEEQTDYKKYKSNARAYLHVKVRKNSVNTDRVGRDSSVCIATRYGLDGPGIEYRLEARFSTPVQTGPGAHPASRTMRAGSFPGVKRGRGVALTTHPHLAPRLKKEHSYTSTPLLGLGGMLQGELFLLRQNPRSEKLKRNTDAAANSRACFTFPGSSVNVAGMSAGLKFESFSKYHQIF